ncbi:ethylene-insensitive protein 2.1-like [Actinidia eriantha]|uniref:ethylene-insensitive protein 2.1-like n=1 Tax=Actinidia eriantha TaxID=165200 RepID=UPI00258394A7|nr:ethylene-insensitive protein 2.1-like [Actinidia eriantha]
MDTEIFTGKNQPRIIQRLLPAVVPTLLIAVGYVDPGKWAAVVEGGAHFGSDLILPMLVFSFGAILCQYLSACIAVVTGRDLSQICSEEYDKAICVFVGVLTEISMIALDITMILGTAHGINLIFGVDLFTCVFLAAIGAVLFPVFATLLDIGKTKVLCILIASFVLLFYVLGVLFSQPEISVSTSGTLPKLSGETAFALMSLLGANIMPHNFYLHSSIVQKDQGPPNVSKGLLFHDHFFAILCTFSSIFLVNYVLMNAAANVFNSTGLDLLTFQDALSLIDQVFRSSIVPFAFLLILFVSNQINTLTWNLGGQGVLHDFFGVDIPGWLHHVTIRINAVIPALYCVWNSGAEGLYRLLIFTQVVVALMLPSSVIPLFRIASSKSVMGVYKVSHFVEFFALTMFFGMLGLKIIFLVEMMFGNCDWVVRLGWNAESSISLSYIVLLITASTLLCLMIWLAATPLKSASSRLDDQVWNWDINDAVPDSSAEQHERHYSETRYGREESIQKQEPSVSLGKSFESHQTVLPNSDLNLPETLLDSDTIPFVTTIGDNDSNITFPSPTSHLEVSSTPVETGEVSTVCSEGSVSESVETVVSKAESIDMVERSVRIERNSQIEKDSDGDTWDPETSSKGVSVSSPSLTSEGPGSYRSLSGKSEDGGSGAGSLSRLAGLGRAARRQLTVVLDDFWGQLFDFHGQATREAKTTRLDVLRGVDSKVDPKSTTPLKVDASVKEFTGYFPSMGGKGSDSPMNSSVYDSPKPLGLQGNISSSWLSSLQFSDAYAQNSSQNAFDAGERRYSSLRLPPSSEGNDYQPATVHGYQIASYLGKIAKEKSYGSCDYLNGQMEERTPKSTSMGTANYRDPLAFSSGRKLQIRSTTMNPPGFSKPIVSRNVSLQSERPFNDLCSPGPAENPSNALNTKKFHSLPDISGISLRYREAGLSDKSAQWGGTIGYGTSSYSSTSLKVGSPLAFDNLSPPKPYRDPLTLQFSSSSSLNTGSLWSKQPFEQFGLSDKIRTVGNKQSSATSETTLVVDLEAKLLKSFRHCIIKLWKLEGSEWLFGQNDGADEDLIDRVAARERFLYEAETREMSRLVHMVEPQYSLDRKPGSALKNDDIDYSNFLVSSVPHCGEGCVWSMDLIISFGVWCIHRILDLSLMESRPELWGKYTYVLNRLQGIIDPAFSKPRTPTTTCFCLQIPVAHQARSSPPPISNLGLPPPAKQGKGKCTTASMLLEIIKDVETAISCRKGRSGTAAGDVAFPKGKENLASVLKRYKRRLSSKSVSSQEGVSGSRTSPTSAPYGS